jgi:hypothetical protein
MSASFEAILLWGSSWQLQLVPVYEVSRCFFGPTAATNCCKQAWLLKNSRFVKIAGIWDIENVYQNGDRRL